MDRVTFCMANFTGLSCLTFIHESSSTYHSLHGLAVSYLVELCTPVADIAGQQRLQLATRGYLDTHSTYGKRAFVDVGSSV